MSHLMFNVSAGILVVADAVLAYGLAEKLIKRRWYKKMSPVWLVKDSDNRAKSPVRWLRRWAGKRISLYIQAGYPRTEAKRLVYGYGCLCLILTFVAAWRSLLWAALAWIPVEILRRWRLKQYQRQFESRFNQNLYKIYRFLYTQLMAGHSSVEILRQIHLAAPDDDMRSAMNAFTGSYFRTLNFERASMELLQRYPVKASEVLLSILRQGIESGDAMDLIQRQEEVMIQRYMDAVILENEQIQLKLILLIVASGGIVFAIMGIPLVLQMLEALKILFV
jgi:Flp pilus assembly protein TadB